MKHGGVHERQRAEVCCPGDGAAGKRWAYIVEDRMHPKRRTGGWLTRALTCDGTGVGGFTFAVEAERA
jgi:hypothetical protein